MNRASLLKSLKKYTTTYEQEFSFVGRFQDLLLVDNCFERSLTTGHLTASAWVLNTGLNKVLLLHHKKLDRWLQPGGHADGDENLLKVAKKELEEEAGIKTTKNVLLRGEEIFDLDIHTIPSRSGEPEHQHYDVRFAFVALKKEELQGNSESKNLQWIDLDKLEDHVGSEQSILRMWEKTRGLAM